MQRRSTEDSQSAIAPLLIVLAAVLVVLALPTAAAGAVDAGRTAAQKSDPAEKDALESLVGKLTFAWNEGDVDGVASLFSPDGQLVTPSGKVTRRRAQIRKLIAKERTTRLDGTTLTQNVSRISFTRADSAVLRGKYAITGSICSLD